MSKAHPYYEARKQAHLCVDCGKPLPPGPYEFVRCPGCREDHKIRMKRYNARKAGQHVPDGRRKRGRPKKTPVEKKIPDGANWKDKSGHWYTYMDDVPREQDGTPISCVGCYHRQNFHGTTICAYGTDMGTPRGCTIAECHHWRHSPEGKRRTIETTAQRMEREQYDKWS